MHASACPLRVQRIAMRAIGDAGARAPCGSVRRVAIWRRTASPLRCAFASGADPRADALCGIEKLFLLNEVSAPAAKFPRRMIRLGTRHTRQDVRNDQNIREEV